jgi:hypothetical protein
MKTLFTFLMLAGMATATEPTIQVTQEMQVRDLAYGEWGGDFFEGPNSCIGEKVQDYFRVEKKVALKNGMTGYYLLGYMIREQIKPYNQCKERDYQPVYSHNGVEWNNTPEGVLSFLVGTKLYKHNFNHAPARAEGFVKN